MSGSPTDHGDWSMSTPCGTERALELGHVPPIQGGRRDGESWVKPIAPGLAMGPAACSFSVLERPFQNRATFTVAFSRQYRQDGRRMPV